jgi:multiple sugar transport system permease protein
LIGARLREGAATPYLFLAPFLSLYAVFLLFPIGQGLWVSLTDWDMMRADKPFVGLDNFRYLFFRDSLFWPSVRTTVVYLVLNVPVKIVLGLAFALALHEKVRGTVFFRTAIFVPFVINTAAVGLLGQWILNPHVGALNYYLGRLGLPAQQWLAEPTWTMVVVVAVTVWWSIAFNTVVVLAGLQDIPEELFEAAKIDGAGAWNRLLHVTLPGLRGPVMFVTVMQIIGSFQAFGNIYMLTGGGPVDATRVLMIHLYETGFVYFRMGPAAAMAVMLFVIVMALTVVQLRLFRSEVGR